MIRRLVNISKRYNYIQWALFDQAMVSGVNFLTGILLARFLGLEEFGRFALAWMAVKFVNGITHALVNAPMMSIGPKQDKGDMPGYYGAVIVQNLVLALTAFALLFLMVSMSGIIFPESDIEGLALPLASAAFAFQVHDFLRRYFFTRGRPLQALVGDLLRYLGQILTLVWLFLVLDAAIETASVLWIIAGFAIGATALLAFFIERPKWDPAVFRATVVRHWHFSKWLAGSAIVRWGKENLLIVISGGLLGVSAVGALQAARSIMGVNHILFMGLENVLPARAASILKTQGQGVMVSYLKKVGLFGGLLTAAFALIAGVAPEFWLNLLFGEEYKGFGYILQWYAAIYLVMFVSLVFRMTFRTIEVTHPIFLGNLIGVLLNILLAYPLISNLGLTGVVFGSFGIHLIVLGILWLYLSRELKKRNP